MYYWRVRKVLPQYYGQRCEVLARGRRNSCLVRFADGVMHVTSRRYVRKVKEQ